MEVWNAIVREDLTAGIFELRPEGNKEGGSCARLWGEGYPRQKEEKPLEEKAWRKGYDWHDDKEASVAGEGRAEREMRAEVEGARSHKVF